MELSDRATTLRSYYLTPVGDKSERGMIDRKMLIFHLTLHVKIFMHFGKIYHYERHHIISVHFW